ncbi:MAG: hypothetical protein KDK99_20690, partial [Verrucomicrobiales bacterium]|nr:hypothetical protein [Verrucomicrobiales bacterium]
MNRLHYPDTKANPPNDQPANLFTEARLPRHLVHQTQAAILRDTFSNSGSIRIGMERLQIRPTGTADENPRIALFGSDARCHRSPVSILNSLLVSCAHRAAIDLHRLACDVQPIAASPLSEECFGVAFFAET